ncbi:hypothetical protein HK100_009572 [Physocladia obscura]|uniref:Minichromosome loss protein Mcl1 middle region domain-containing protein n=1 Tax=Physocladia obscura TaxID=109957 RepID=A0AAD5T977_9FUNG|nr:hypothetical protein HK100_009572 [Physocladia obscura]
MKGVIPAHALAAPKDFVPNTSGVVFVGADTSGSAQIAVAASRDNSLVRVIDVRDLAEVSDSDIANQTPTTAVSLLEAVPRKDSHVLCIDSMNDWIAVGLESAEALLYSAFDLGFEKTLARFTTPLHAVRFRPCPNKLLRPNIQLAAAGEDAEIRLINIDDIKDTVVIKGHNDSIKSLAFSPDGDFLASVDARGDLHIWDLRPSKPSCLQILKGVLPDTSVDLKDYGRVSWHPSGKFLAIPGVYKDIKILDTKTWASVHTFQNHSKLVTAVQYNHDGTIISSSDQGGKIYLWNANSRESSPFKTIKSPSIVTDFRWHPSKNNLVIVTDSFEIEYVEDIIAPAAEVVERTANASENHISELPAKDAILPPYTKASTPSSNQKKKSDLVPPKQSNNSVIDESDDYDDFVDDDDGNGYADVIESREDARKYYEKQKRILKPGKSSVTGGGGLALSSYFANANQEVTEIQESFQPGATPLKGSKRYLAFNLLGVIYSIVQQSQCIIHILHHDKAKNRDFSFPNRHNFTMAAMMARGAVFATDPSDISTTTSSATISIVQYKPFDGFNSDSNDGWSIEFGASENVKGVCMTGRGIVVATDARYLRFFSFGGVQIDVRCLDGPVVAVAGDGGDFVFVVYHLGGAFHGDQNLGYLLLNVSQTLPVIVRKSGLPISPGSTLEWIGFSDAGFLASFDSTEVLRVASPYNHDSVDDAWRPIFDGRIAREGKQLSFWPIGVTTDKLMCVICKSGDRHANPPKSVITDVDIHMPMLEATADDSSNSEMVARAKTVADEEKVLITRIMSNHAVNKMQSSGANDVRSLKAKHGGEIDKQVLQQFVVACKAGNTQKSLDLVMTLTTTHAINGAMKFAVTFHRESLAHKINQIKEVFMKREEELARRYAIPYAINAPVSSIPTAAKYSAASLSSNLHTSTTAEKLPNATQQISHRVHENHEDAEMNSFDDDDGSPPPSHQHETLKRENGRNSLAAFSGTREHQSMSKLKTDASKDQQAVSVVKVKNPFSNSLSSGGGSKFLAAGKASSVGSLFQDLKHCAHPAKDTKNSTKEVSEKIGAVTVDSAKKRKQESLFGFFPKKPKSNVEFVGSETEKSNSNFALTDSEASVDVQQIDGNVNDDDMFFDMELSKLKSDSNDSSTFEKENESDRSPTWEEKGKMTA